MPSPPMKPVYALVGSDSFLQLEELKRILAEVGGGVQRVDVEGEKAELAEVLDELRSFAMFGAGKLVVVRDADDFITRFREQMEDYCAKPSDSAVLVLRFDSLPANQRIYKAIAKTGEVRKCETPKDLEKWITERAKSEHALAIGPDAARMLKELLGDDLGKIDNELAKLAIQNDGAGAGKVGAEAVADNVTFQREQQMWDLTDAVAAGNAAEAIRRWRHLVVSDPSSEFRAVTWLTIWLENTRKALAMKREGMNAFSIAKALRIWPPEKGEAFLKTASAMGDAGVGRAIDLLAEIDKQSKTGVGDAVENVERFILSVATGK